MTASTRPWLSSAAIVVANLASLVVFWWYGWNVHAVLLVYWLETGVVSAVYFAKILRAEGTDDPEAVRSWAAFDGKPAERLVGKPNREIADAVVLQFTGPWLAFGLFFVLSGSLFDTLEPASPDTVALAAVVLLVYHVLSYQLEYVGLAEYERRGPVSLFTELAPRHLAVVLMWIFGLGAATATRTPAAAIVVLVIFNTCIDLATHRRARARTGP